MRKGVWFAKILSARNWLTRRVMDGKNRRDASAFTLLFVFRFVLFVLRFVRLLLSGHQAVAIKNAVLRMQIAAFQRKRKRPLLTTLDRIFWVTLRSVWSDWRHPLLYVQAGCTYITVSGNGKTGIILFRTTKVGCFKGHCTFERLIAR
jgi:hypothetical protein